MARKRRSSRLVVPSAERAMDAFKVDVMRKEGYDVDPQRPDDVKFEVAKELGIPLKRGDNGEMKTEDAGRVGGRIGGSMVKEMIRMAQEKLNQK